MLLVGERNRLSACLGMGVVANFIRQNGEVSVLSVSQSVFHMIQISDGRELNKNKVTVDSLNTAELNLFSPNRNIMPLSFFFSLIQPTLPPWNLLKDKLYKTITLVCHTNLNSSNDTSLKKNVDLYFELYLTGGCIHRCSCQLHLLLLELLVPSTVSLWPCLV